MTGKIHSTQQLHIHNSHKLAPGQVLKLSIILILWGKKKLFSFLLRKSFVLRIKFNNEVVVLESKLVNWS